MIDGKGSPDFRARLEALAAGAGRDLRVRSFRGPTVYNPLALGTPTELRAKVTKMDDWTEPHDKRAAARYLGFV